MLKQPRVLVVEDEPDIRMLIQTHLARNGVQIVAVEDGETGMRRLEEETFNLAVLDWMLPGMSGLDLCKKFAGRLPILMVTARSEAADIVLGLEMGADDYITKPFEIPVFLARVRALLRRASLAPSTGGAERFEIGDLKVDVTRHLVHCRGEELKLTLSEFKLLVALLGHRGKVLSRDRLISLVQGGDVSVTDRTIDTHVFGLRKKLGDCAAVIETIRGIGYRVQT